MEYAPAVRALLPFLLIACKPSATIDSTMPVANLQSYQTVGVRMHTNAFASQGQALMLEKNVIDNLRLKCGFSSVDRAGSTPADVVLDLNITSVSRGGGGMISSQAVVDTLVVLTDGQAGELLGTVKIKGKSSGMIINNNVPETQALEVVAKTIGDLLAKSGCAGPRVAKAEPPPVVAPPPVAGTNPPPAIDESKRPQAEGFNDQGKEKLYAADLAGALALFQQAAGLIPDAKYQYNVCLTLGAQEQWDPAIQACEKARSMSPSAALNAKIDTRIGLLQKRQ